MEELGPLLDEPARAVLAAGLLVGDRREDDVAPQLRARAAQREHHRQLHGDHVLHVDRAAAPDHAVDEIAAERVARPGLRVDGDDVDVAEQDERRLGGGAAGGEARDARAAARGSAR